MDFDIASIGTCVPIIVLCFLIGAGLKASKKVKNNDIIPVCCGVAGAVIGVIAYAFKMPSFPGTDPLVSAAIGAISGLSATGIKEVTKLFKSSEE